jgi:hypothetical protein
MPLLLRPLKQKEENNENTLRLWFGKQAYLATFALPIRQSGKAARQGLQTGLRVPAPFILPSTAGTYLLVSFVDTRVLTKAKCKKKRENIFPFLLQRKEKFLPLQPQTERKVLREKQPPAQQESKPGKNLKKRFGC